MVNSGTAVDLSPIKGFKIDKHSTGGVGDKTTLVLAPLAASCGAIVPKMSGRELGHTGGTIDKLESIPGMRTDFSKDQFIDITNRVGMSIIGQTQSLAPADKLIYALRNVTATVDSIPLIASSIMSKKLAAGADGIVLDVKTGAGAFMPVFSDAVELAKTMVDIGVGAGKKITALITGMEEPLGYAVGNALEVKEAIHTLQGRGPADLSQLVLALGSEMLLLSGEASSREAAAEKLQTSLNEKAAAEQLKAWIAVQGGQAAVVDDTDMLPASRAVVPLASTFSGFVQAIDAFEAGMAAKTLGAGRKTTADVIDSSVGILLKKKVGDRVEKGEPLAMLHTDGDEAKLNPAVERLRAAFRIGPQAAAPGQLVLARVTPNHVEELR
jgi:pyrimidine-nucleoside phosphorylase